MSAVALPPPAMFKSPSVLPIRPDDLLEMDGAFELVDGQLVEKHMGFDAGDTAVIVSSTLFAFARAGKLGKVVSEVTFQCFPDKPGQVRRPDVAFVARARLPGAPGTGHVPIRPDLVVEVTSPEEKVVDQDAKLADYQSVGVPLVWVFNPELRIVRVYLPNGSSQLFKESETLDGGDVLPGFAVAVRDLLPAAGEA